MLKNNEEVEKMFKSVGSMYILSPLHIAIPDYEKPDERQTTLLIPYPYHVKDSKDMGGMHRDTNLFLQTIRRNHRFKLS